MFVRHLSHIALKRSFEFRSKQANVFTTKCLNTGSNPVSGSRSILLVLAVRGSDNNTAITDVVPRATENLGAG